MTKGIDVADTADRLRQLLRDMPKPLAADALPADRSKRSREISAQSRLIDGVRQQLAIAFGEARGWRLSKSRFSVPVLMRRGRHDGRAAGESDWPSEFTDHTYYYRSADGLAAAVAGHPYDGGEGVKRSAAEWAVSRGLVFSSPADFPSWWFPGWTTLMLFEPAR